MYLHMLHNGLYDSFSVFKLPVSIFDMFGSRHIGPHDVNFTSTWVNFSKHFDEKIPIHYVNRMYFIFITPLPRGDDFFFSPVYTWIFDTFF